MKISTKIVLGTWIIIALCFSLGGTYTIHKNFQVAFDEAVENHQRQHIMNRYSLESNIRNGAESGETFSTELVIKYAKRITDYGQDNTKMVLTEIVEKAENKIFYKNIKSIDKKLQKFIDDGGATHYEVYEKDGKHYLMMASILDFYEEHRIKIVNRYDISKTYADRERQIRDFIQLDIMVMVLSFILILILAYFLTKNIKKLSVSSSRIAEGEYGIRTNIHSSDEIGELSKNFDIMAESIENHIHQLETDIEAREQFVSDFSHELKTPMTSMMGYSQLLLGNSLDESKREKAANYIYSECNRLRNLSNTLLKMLGILEENIDRRWVYTEWIAEQMESLCSDEMKNSRLKMDVEEALLNTDAELVITLLKNLISNGDKACHSKNTDIVSVTGRIDGVTENYVFTVSDTGCGMEKEEIDKITRPFYMIDKSRSRSEGGSGIGLAICSKICQFLDIDMKIESEINRGTTVTLIFKECRIEEEMA